MIYLRLDDPTPERRKSGNDDIDYVLEENVLKKAASINLDQQQSSPRVRKASAEPVIKPANLAECETFEGNKNEKFMY